MAMAMVSSLGLPQLLEVRHPKANPSQGRAKPTTSTCHVISENMKNWDQIPNTRMNRIRNRASGFIIFTRNLDTLDDVY